MRVEVRPALLRWAQERAGLDTDELTRRFPKFSDWEQERARPTLKQLEHFAQSTHTPIGYLFLSEPPAEQVPIPDFRTMGTRPVMRPSPDLLDTIYICQQRQEWYRDFMRSQRADALAFVGSVTLASNVEATATAIRTALGFDINERQQLPTWTDALHRTHHPTCSCARRRATCTPAAPRS
jgi:transcriptional regulator with XRE-family HTH domain